MKKYKLIALLLTLSLLLTSCGQLKLSEMFGEDTNNKTDNTESVNDNLTRLGITTAELDELLRNFVHKIYLPQSEADINSGVELLKDYITDRVYENLIDSLGEYNEDIKQVLTHYYFNYAWGDGTHDHQEHAYIEFNFKHDGYLSKVAIEFGINEEGKIYKYSVYDGGSAPA